MLLLNTASCRSPGTLQRIAELEKITGIAQATPRTEHDTLYLSQVKYDSIYLSENSTERFHPSSFHYDTLAQIYYRVDTISKESRKTEFRYKLLHDTTYINKVDTIPKVITVQKPPTADAVPLWWKLLVLATLLLLWKRLCPPLTASHM